MPTLCMPDYGMPHTGKRIGKKKHEDLVHLWDGIIPAL